MSNSEQISRLVDSDLDVGQRDELLSQVISSDRSVQQWQNYHLIGSVIRGDVKQSGTDLRDRISKALEEEPTKLAPVARKKTSEAGDRASVWRSAGMLAVAASVALVAVISINPSENLQGTQIAAVTSESTQTVTQVSTQASTDSEAEQRTLLQQELGAMLAEHGEFSTSSGLNGLIAYAKLVSAEQVSE